MYKGTLQYSKLTVFLSPGFFFFFFFFLQNDVEAPAYLRTPGYAPEALGKLTSGLSVLDSEAGAERPENVRLSPLPACISRHALLGLADCPYTQTASGSSHASGGGSGVKM